MLNFLLSIKPIRTICECIIELFAPRRHPIKTPYCVITKNEKTGKWEVNID